MAKTKNGIVYPDNYDKVADVPADLKELAESVDEVIENNKTEMKKSNETRDGKISKNTENIEAIQGSIKTAIETINKKDNEQDEDIKANKESIEELKAENLEIKVENERLRNDIKSIALQGEANGENIHLEDSSEARCEIKICGNQKQNTREGYNLLNLEKYAYSETISNINGGKIEVSKGIVNLNGTNATARMTAKSKDIASSEFDIIPAGTYFFGVNCNLVPVSGGSLLQPKLGIQELKEDYYLTQWYAICDVNKTESYPLLISKDTQKTTYEQYGASPSIDYPSPVKSVGNIKNILDMSNAKGGTSGGITCTMNKDGSYRYVGTATAVSINVWLLGAYGTAASTLFSLEPGTYYISGVALFEGTGKLNNEVDKYVYTFIQKHNITGVRAEAAVSGRTYDETKYPIIAKIDHEIPWVPYNYGSVQVNVQNKNIMSLYRLGEYWKYTDKGIKNTAISTGKDLTKFSLKAGQTIKIGFKLLSKPSQDTTFTCYVDKVRSIIPSFSKIATYNLNQVYERTYTATKDCEISVTLWGNANSDIFEFQMWAEYDSLTKYQRHEEQSYLVDVQQPMFEGDTFVRQDGKWYEKHFFPTMLLNGTEKAGVSGASTNEILAIVYDINNAVDGFGYSNYFLYSSQLELNKMSVYNSGKSLRINVSKMQFADLESFKAKVKELYEAGTPVIIYYKLAEPILLECTEAQSKVLDEIYNKAHTYKNITNISAESTEVNPIVSLKYLKDTETEHNKLQAQIDEIKQLLSTTETSAMLLNNMQTDLESEV